ncbi:hypothetical protein E5720_17545 [Rhodococcus sp. PAMC28707]|uniref:hypothetical protein n=1 Tax=unclassified Rhodococcus (in: high G+C Gram-positive bacteria) TaxID=192944 RepID=UPI00109DF565|nr:MULTISPECIES: hypothetical protein [unclassified Rhodococcus (in: high G+C Gram-positive bacteria)]QCB60023.1 hypothetical protein E5720_17545 [Rhodococcus sp. PAMC28707]
MTTHHLSQRVRMDATSSVSTSNDRVDALLTWTVLIAKAAALGGLDPHAAPVSPKSGFRR